MATLDLDYNSSIVANVVQAFEGYCHPVRVYNVVKRIKEEDREVLCNQIIQYKKTHNGCNLKQVIVELKIPLKT